MPSFKIVARKNTEVVLADNGRFYFVDQDGTVLESISADAQGSVDIIKDLNVGEDLSVVNDATVGNNLTVTGNLYVEGDRVIARTEIVTVDDNILTLNANVTTGVPSEEVGIEALRGTETRARVIWDETQDLWTAGVSGAEDIIVLKATADNDYVNVTGDTMTGDLVVTAGVTGAGLTDSNLSGNTDEIVILDVNGKLVASGDTVNTLVDNVSAGLQTIFDDRYVNVTGDTMTGGLTANNLLVNDTSYGSILTKGGVVTQNESGQRVEIGSTLSIYDNSGSLWTCYPFDVDTTLRIDTPSNSDAFTFTDNADLSVGNDLSVGGDLTVSGATKVSISIYDLAGSDATLNQTGIVRIRSAINSMDKIILWSNPEHGETVNIKNDSAFSVPIESFDGTPIETLTSGSGNKYSYDGVTTTSLSGWFALY